MMYSSECAKFHIDNQITYLTGIILITPTIILSQLLMIAPV